MSVLDDLELSNEALELIGKVEAAKLVRSQARVNLNKQLQWQAVMEDDDTDIRRRTRGVFKSLMGQDTTDCVDEPLEMPEDCEDDVRITVLGDVVGDKAAQILSQNNQPQDPPVTPPKPPTPKPHPKPSDWWMRLLASLLALGMAAALIMLAVLLTKPPPQYQAEIQYDAELVKKAIREVQIP